MTATHSSDHLTVERILESFYALAGLSRPQFMWFDGPLSCMTTASLMMRPSSGKSHGPGESVEEEIRRQLSTYTWWKLETQLKSQPSLYETARRTEGWRDLWYPILNLSQGAPPVSNTTDDHELLEYFYCVETEEWDKLNKHVMATLDSGLCSTLALGSEPLEGFWGGTGGWVGRYLGCELAGARFVGAAAELLHCWETLQRVCGWWHPFERAVLCCDRPSRSHWDSAGRLHDTDGPALEFLDGFKVYAWHGVPIPRDQCLATQRVAPRQLTFRERVRAATRATLGTGRW